MGFRKFSVLLGAAVAVAVLGAGSAKAATYNLLSGPQELSTLIGNIGTVGGLSFSFTSYTPPVGGPTAGQVLVSAFSAGGEVGIAFTPNNGSTGWTAPLGSSNDASILFSVSTTDGSLIDDDYLAVGGAAQPTSSWEVDETVSPANGGSLTINETSGNTTTDPSTATFTPVSSVNIIKDINVNSVTAVANITTIDQGFSTTLAVPLPDAAFMGVSTLLGLGVMGALRKRLQQA